jgi:hypothetical protein
LAWRVICASDGRLAWICGRAMVDGQFHHRFFGEIG